MKANKLYRLSFFCLALIFWLYLWLRAWHNPLVFDEATSYFLFIKNGNYLPGEAFWSANNHLLNSALATLSASFLGPSELALRLPNLLAFPLFAFYGFRLMRTLESSFLRWWALLLFFSLHGILEFFAYARGYGLMLAFLFGALWHFRRLFQHFRLKDLLWLIAYSGLCLLSNVSALPLIAILLLPSGYLLLQTNFKFSQKLSLSLLGSLPILFGLWWSFSLKEHQQLYYGGQGGFIDDSLKSLQSMLLNPSLSVDLFLAAGALLLIALILARPWHYKTRNLSIWTSLAFLAITAFYPIGHWLIGLKFPFDRALIYWFCFGLISFLALLDWHYQRGRRSLVFFLAWSVIFPLFLLHKLSLENASFQAWSQEQIPNRFYKKLVSLESQNFGGTYLYEPQWNFLQQKYGAALSAYQVNTGESLDYRLAEASERSRWQDNYSPIDSNAAGLYLLQRKRKLKRSLLGSFKLEGHEKYREGKIIKEFSHDSLPQAISTKLRLQISQAHKLAFAIQAFDLHGKQVYWRAYRAREYLRPEKEWQDWHLFVVLKELPEETERLKLFLWNPENEAFSLKKSEWTLWELN